MKSHWMSIPRNIKLDAFEDSRRRIFVIGTDEVENILDDDSIVIEDATPGSLMATRPQGNYDYDTDVSMMDENEREDVMDDCLKEMQKKVKDAGYSMEVYLATPKIRGSGNLASPFVIQFIVFSKPSEERDAAWDGAIEYINKQINYIRVNGGTPRSGELSPDRYNQLLDQVYVVKNYLENMSLPLNDTFGPNADYINIKENPNYQTFLHWIDEIEANEDNLQQVMGITVKVVDSLNAMVSDLQKAKDDPSSWKSFKAIRRLAYAHIMKAFLKRLQ